MGDILRALSVPEMTTKKVSSPETGDQTKIKTKMWNSSMHFHHCYASEFSGEHFKLMALDAVYGQ